MVYWAYIDINQTHDPETTDSYIVTIDTCSVFTGKGLEVTAYITLYTENIQ